MNEGGRASTAPAHKFFDAVHVEGEGNAEGLVERIGRRCGHYVAGIDAEHVHFETGAEGEVFAVALHGAFVVVASAQGKLVVVGVFCPQAPLHLFEFTFEPTFAVAEAFEHARDGGDVIMVAAHPLLVVLVGFARELEGKGGDEELVGLCRDGKAVVLVDGEGEVEPHAQIGGQEVGIVRAEVDFRANVAHIEPPCQVALSVAEGDIVIPVHRDIGSKGRTCRNIVLVVAGEIGVHVAKRNGCRELFGKHARVGHIDGKFIGLDGDTVVRNFAHGEVFDAARDGLVVAQSHVAHSVGQRNSFGELAQPRGVVDGKSGTRDVERILGGVPRLSVDIGLCGSTDVAHGCSACIGGNGLRDHGCANGVELVLDVFLGGSGEADTDIGEQEQESLHGERR